jgi:two-component system alkaline phosphatase synthesis response regulator PhoP
MGKFKILIADDDPYVHELVDTVFSTDEFDVSHAYDGSEAVEFIKEVKPDLVVLDIMMPGKDGRDICRDVKKDLITRDISVLILSARDDQLDRICGLEIGADEYMVKPFSPNHLLRRVRKILEKE